MQPQPAQQTPSTTQAIPESEAVARDIREDNLGGFVGNIDHLTGDATFGGMMRVDGHLSGNVASADGTLIVSTNGLVDASDVTLYRLVMCVLRQRVGGRVHAVVRPLTVSS